MGEKAANKEVDKLSESLNDLFTNVSTMIKGELQGTNNLLELLEKMNTRVAEEYKGLGDVASGLRVFVEQLKEKNGNFDEYVQQIEAMEQQLTEFEAVVSVLDKHVSLLESKVHSAYQQSPT
ncbi:biogenesis of lysosome-related organelles complex 1 subunit 2-like [Papaver somniferum]|uniref:biogenesis of lysosome-related organelles complex 1 subunit 2-like n=1 Tax=Papaver somniferum TaxID=3469 RepID=UPI000E7060B2|nr:biogenesis of lysosome-related organelles complex 1 subunit 2-like [Papaver somniferum]XP_026421433.1 biogenesis of lysosome-related organelles complex 1 subunit 2-like [Papaver somniferum]XP_026421434.1 biogenesis of lysosome-related organelles complex 1 subunit 2-like [Papaver somniferum]XP_026421435.1 biogenesis of lysosome-related organelles complex 1 subunit 2-like [Papaver somniferum]XP_026421436.1 biogenesis of lysosome-related organelles complex 1 subunit 2-like [Papaver somniferum]